jgi:hypothetical protein
MVKVRQVKVRQANCWLLYQIRLIAPNKISLGIFPISFQPRPFASLVPLPPPPRFFYESLPGFDITSLADILHLYVKKT